MTTTISKATIAGLAALSLAGTTLAIRAGYCRHLGLEACAAAGMAAAAGMVAGGWRRPGLVGSGRRRRSGRGRACWPLPTMATAMAAAAPPTARSMTNTAITSVSSL